MIILKYIYLFFAFFALFFCGSFTLGPLSIRNYFALSLLAISTFAQKTIVDSTVRAFLWYLVILIFVNILNGCFSTSSFIKLMLAHQLPSFIVVYSLPKLLKNRQEVLVSMNLIVILFVINVVITYGQFVGNSSAILIQSFLGYGVSDFAGDQRLGSYLGGLTGNVVNNGYFIASMLPVSVIGIWSEKKYFRIIGYVILLVASYCIYIVQQRTTFLILLVFYVFLLLYKKDKILITMGVCLLCVVLFNADVFTGIDMGRLSVETSNDDRLALFADFYRFVNSPDIFLGGAQIFYDQYNGGAQHNTFTSALVLGGIPVFISFVWLMYKILCSLNQYRKKVYNNEIYNLPLCFGCVAFVLCSMTHSTGIQNDGLLFWLLYGLILSYNKVNSINVKK